MSNTQRSFKKRINVLYEDDHCIVFDKPSGVVVIPTPQKELSTLVNFVNQQFCTPQSQYRLHPCHRLDRDTSGAILFAKGKRNQKLLMDAFKGLAVKKKYIAFVHGRMKKIQGQLKSRIRGYEQKRFFPRARAKLAVTHFKVLEVKKHFCVVEVEPVTGRTNQIRIQFKEAGNPLVGERKYAFAKDYPIKFRRVALHAAALSFKNPVTQKVITVNCPLTKDMQNFLSEN